jgi:hypothetical protein
VKERGADGDAAFGQPDAGFVDGDCEHLSIGEWIWGFGRDFSCS